MDQHVHIGNLLSNTQLLNHFRKDGGDLNIDNLFLEAIVDSLFEGAKSFHEDSKKEDKDMAAEAKDFECEQIVHKLDELIEALKEFSARDEEEVRMECPFCGAEVVARKEADRDRWYDECLYCGTKTPSHFHSKDEAIEFWNEWQNRCCARCEEEDE